MIMHLSCSHLSSPVLSRSRSRSFKKKTSRIVRWIEIGLVQSDPMISGPLRSMTRPIKKTENPIQIKQETLISQPFTTCNSVLTTAHASVCVATPLLTLSLAHTIHHHSRLYSRAMPNLLLIILYIMYLDHFMNYMNLCLIMLCIWTILWIMNIFLIMLYTVVTRIVILSSRVSFHTLFGSLLNFYISLWWLLYMDWIRAKHFLKVETITLPIL